MSWGYPDGCTQLDHDRYYDDGARSDDQDPDTELMDCGHYCAVIVSEPAGGKLLCPKCFDARVERVVEITRGENRQCR